MDESYYGIGINGLSDHILLYILQQLPFSEVTKCALVHSRWHEAAGNIRYVTIAVHAECATMLLSSVKTSCKNISCSGHQQVYGGHPPHNHTSLPTGLTAYPHTFLIHTTTDRQPQHCVVLLLFAGAEPVS